MTTKTIFIEKFKMLTGLSTEVATNLLSIPHKSVVVLNTLKSNWPEVHEFILNSADLTANNELPYSYIVNTNKENLTRHPYFKAGGYYILNYSSLIPPLVLDPRPNDRILDMCAAPGGKSFILARMAQNKFNLVLNEVDKRRLSNLTEVLSTLNVSISKTYNLPAQGLPYVLTDKFNKILIDAPCSAEGLINLSDSQSIKYWSQKKVKQLRNLQKKIIHSAYHMLEVGGDIVYSTCTYSPEENEEVIDYVTSKYPDLEIQEIDTSLWKANFTPALLSWQDKLFVGDMSKCIRILPNEVFEGFFVAKLRKVSR